GKLDRRGEPGKVDGRASPILARPGARRKRPGGLPSRRRLPAAPDPGRAGREETLAGAAVAAGPLAPGRRPAAGAAGLPADAPGAAEPGNPGLPPGLDAGPDRPPGEVGQLENARRRLHLAARTRQRLPRV